MFTLGILHFREHLLEFSRPRLGDVLDSWKDIAQVGIPAATVNCMSPVFLGIVMRLAAGFGEHAVAAFGACFRVSGFAPIPVYAAGAAMLPFAGQNWGAREFGRVRHARRSGYRFCLAWGMACVLLLVFAAPHIARMFGQDAEVRSITVLYLMIVPLGFGLQGMIIAATSIMNAINRPLVGAALIFTQFFLISTPLICLGAYLFRVPGMLGASVIADVIACIVALFWATKVCAKAEGWAWPA